MGFCLKSIMINMKSKDTNGNYVHVGRPMIIFHVAPKIFKLELVIMLLLYLPFLALVIDGG